MQYNFTDSESSCLVNIKRRYETLFFTNVHFIPVYIYSSLSLVVNIKRRYKLDHEMFKCWMRILERVPNAVLWLLRFPAAGESNVLMEAASLGVDPRRVVFSDVTDKTGHIRRGSLADMCLDTTLCR